jgi:uncharacterized protein (TIRG00374 family)
MSLKRYYVFIISLSLIFLLILWIGPSNIIGAFKTADWKWLLVALFIHILAVGARSLRWGYIIDKPFDFKNNFIVKTIGLFAGNFSPMRSAGEVMNAVAGKNINKITLHEGLSAGLTERFFDLLIVGSLLVISAVWIENIRFLSILGAFLSLTIVVMIYFVNWREGSGIWIYENLHPFLCKLPLNERYLDSIYLRFKDGLKGMTSYTDSFTNGRNLFIVLFLAIISWLLECIRLYVVFNAFNVEINFTSVIIIFLLANVIGVVSVLPGGIGAIELSLTGLFLLFGVPEALAGSIALADRLVSFWVVSALGLIFSSYYAKDILDEVKEYTFGIKIAKDK